MLIFLYKEYDLIMEYKNNTFIPFNDYEKYKYLGLNYPYMCIFKNNLNLKTPALLMLSFDTKMRLQYRYNESHIFLSSENKIKNISIIINNFENFLNTINDNIKKKKIDLETIISTMIKITMITGMRIGKDIHYKNNNTIGLSTIQKKHIIYIDGKSCIFEFIGKKGVSHHYEIFDKDILKILNILYKNVKKESDFLFVFDNYKLTYLDVNQFLKKIYNNENITGKDLRTLLANILFIEKFLSNIEKFSLKKNIVESTKYVSINLHNTKAISKKSYIFKKIVDYFEKNDTIKETDPIELLKKILKNK